MIIFVIPQIALYFINIFKFINLQFFMCFDQVYIFLLKDMKF